MMSEKNGNVKWRDFGRALLTLLLTLIALIFAQFANGIDNRFNSIEKRTTAIEKRFDSIDIIVHEIKTEIRDLRK